MTIDSVQNKIKEMIALAEDDPESAHDKRMKLLAECVEHLMLEQDAKVREVAAMMKQALDFKIKHYG